MGVVAGAVAAATDKIGLSGHYGAHRRFDRSVCNTGVAGQNLHSIFEALHFQQPAIENRKLGPLPQAYADQFGWEEMVATVAGAYNGLPANLRAKTAIFAQNYGQAGAIDFFGPKYGLPKAISGHQNYFFWGPRDFTGESFICCKADKSDSRIVSLA